MASSTTITVRNISSLNPLKRIKFKENQVIIPIGNGNVSDEDFDDLENGSVLKRKIPLGALGSIENVMFQEGQRKVLGQLQSGNQQQASGPGRRKNTDPKSAITAVERRNARERNRVQQVNNGFAALRQRIPEEIAEAFESGNQRGVHKKLSKVETLRMAVEYIKCLEQLLSLDPEKEGSSLKFTPQPQESQLPATPPPEPVQSNNFFLAIKPRAMGNSSGTSLDQTQITIINGHQYIRIPGTNTFQYLDPESLYDESPNDSSFFADGSSVIDAQDTVLEDSSDLASESAIALSPQSNYTLDPTEHNPEEHVQGAKYVSMINQQQYADIMMIKSELEDVTEQDQDQLLAQTANDPGFLESINWFESHQSCE